MPIPSDQPEAPDRRSLLRGLATTGAAAVAGGAALGAASPASAAVPDAPGAAFDPFAPDTAARGGKVREYWIAAESFTHNAVPNGKDGMMGVTFTPEQTTFTAIGYRAYTPGWGRPLPSDFSPEGVGANTGIPGPTLRAEVGDVIKVHFRNNDHHYKWPHSMHPHGVQYDPNNDGGWLADDPHHPGTAVPYGGTYTYTWVCRPSSVGTWPYHDHSAPQTVPAAGATGMAKPQAMAAGPGVMEIGAELGLLGVIAVTDQHTPRVDREFVLVFHDVYQADVPSIGQDIDCFNGRAFVDNTPTFRAKVGERVRWRIVALGKEFHVFHLHGHRWRNQEGYQGWVDSQILGPSTSLTVEYLEDNPGHWIYHCHVTDHMMGGMVGRYIVEK